MRCRQQLWFPLFGLKEAQNGFLNRLVLCYFISSLIVVFLFITPLYLFIILIVCFFVWRCIECSIFFTSLICNLNRIYTANVPQNNTLVISYISHINKVVFHYLKYFLKNFVPYKSYFTEFTFVLLSIKYFITK